MAQNKKVTRHIAIRVRIYPTQKQAELIEKTFRCCRYLWNAMLSDEMEFYTATDLHYIPAPGKYKKSAPFLKEADSCALSAEHTLLRQAFQRFLRDPVNNRHPVFKSEKDRRNSYRAYCAYRKNGTPSIRIDGEGIVLPKVKWVRAGIYRRPLHWWRLNYVTVSRSARGDYYCSLVYEYQESVVEQKLDEENAVGIQFSTSRLYVDSDGYTPNPPRWREREQERLAKLQRKLARMQPGSKNYQEQQARIQRLHEHIANQRNDFIHKESHRIAQEKDIVCVPGANVRELSGRLPRGDAMDSGFGRLRTCLQYKLERKGKAYVPIDRYVPTVKICHICGSVNDALTVREHTWVCPTCGAKLKRELNAAINIREIGLRQWESEKNESDK